MAHSHGLQALEDTQAWLTDSCQGRMRRESIAMSNNVPLLNLRGR